MEERLHISMSVCMIGRSARARNRIAVCLFLFYLPSILALGAFCLLSPVQGEESATLGARLGEGFRIGGECAFWVVAAAIEDTLLFAYLLY